MRKSLCSSLFRVRKYTKMKKLIIVGGANGSGKTTFSKEITAQNNLEFLNADEIERELREQSKDKSSKLVTAGKEFFRRLDSLLNKGESFVLESTLSGNYLKKVIQRAISLDYKIQIVYVFLKSPDDCIYRVKVRVKLGGHHVPTEDIIRRFYRSKNNFWKKYKNGVNDWFMYYNSNSGIPVQVAIGNKDCYAVKHNHLLEEFLKDIEL